MGNYTMVDYGTYAHYENGSLQHNFKQVFHYYPNLKFLYPFEKERMYMGYGWADWAGENMRVGIYICAAYLAFCFLGQIAMRNRQPFDLRGKLAVWNFVLSLFSFIGAFRTVSHLLTNIINQGYKYSLCHLAPEGYGFSASGMWVALFIFSKIPELGDTVFIVLRKKPLIFLHWYHHITVLLYCWHSYATHSSAGLYFVAMNYTVHALMYGYYFLTAIRAKPAWLNPFFITILQLAQMVGGMLVCLSVFYYKYIEKMGDDCHCQGDNLFWGLAMYASYFALFLEFLLNRYFFKDPKTKTMKRKAAKAE